MIPRSDALAAVQTESFDVVVVGVASPLPAWLPMRPRAAKALPSWRSPTSRPARRAAPQSSCTEGCAPAELSTSVFREAVVDLMVKLAPQLALLAPMAWRRGRDEDEVTGLAGRAARAAGALSGERLEEAPPKAGAAPEEAA